MEIIAIVVVFSVLIVLVASGKLKTKGDRIEEAVAGANAKSQGKASGTIKRTYLIAASDKSKVTFEVHYESKGVKAETVAIGSPRYDVLKKYEPERLRLEGEIGNDITITYNDGRVVKCICSWMNWEASQMRNTMLVQTKKETIQ